MSACWVCLYAVCLMTVCEAVLLTDSPDLEFGDAAPDFSTVLQSCLRAEGTVLPCLSKSALAGLVRVNDQDNVEVADGVTLLRDVADQSPRTLIPIDRDPSDFRSVLDATTAFLNRRALRWDMSRILPGLVLKVGPSFSGAGIMEFVMDQRYSSYSDRQLGTGRLLLKQTLLPFLLGFKINLVTLIPLVFFLLVLISKKALLLGKVALFLSGFLGLNSLFLLQQNQQQQQHQYFQDPFGYSSNSQVLDPLGLYGGHVFRGVNDNHQARAKQDDKGGRNFAWGEERQE